MANLQAARSCQQTLANILLERICFNPFSGCLSFFYFILACPYYILFILPDFTPSYSLHLEPV